MLFNSCEYAIFLPIVFLLYWFVFDYALRNCKHQLCLQNLFIVVVSYIFYGWWNWRFLILIALTSFLSWASGLLIEKESINEDSCSIGGHSCLTKRKIYLTLNITINLLILGIFKYFNFFVDSFCDLFGLTNSITIKVILPVGISFYTFQALSYSIDVYRKKIAATKDIVAFFAYVSFFPQLVAGPIERATNLLPQFERKRTFDYGEAADGMRRILWGLFKKMVVADNCAMFVNSTWSHYGDCSGSTLALAAILFSFQIYGDFSGYSDIAIGTARLFGIRLRENFINPYFSRNVAEFWKRWHISLNTWFVDYVYIPLGGSREGKWKTIRNTFAIFLLSGLWHGASWTYVSWGVFHAILFIILILLGRTKAYRGNASWYELPQMLFTFTLVTFSRIFSRAPSIADAWHFMCGLMEWDTLRAIYRFFYSESIRLSSWPIVAMLLIEWLNRGANHGFDIRRMPNALRVIAYWVLVLAIVLFSGQNQSFIYFQF